MVTIIRLLPLGGSVTRAGVGARDPNRCRAWDNLLRSAVPTDSYTLLLSKKEVTGFWPRGGFTYTTGGPLDKDGF